MVAFRCAVAYALPVLLIACSLDSSALGPDDSSVDGGSSLDAMPDGFVPPDGSVPEDGGPDAFVPLDAGPGDGGPDGFVPDACAPEAETCNGADDDCDGAVDEDLTAPACALSDGVCAGTTQSCGGTSGWIACDSSTYGASYESTETTCDELDNDCDGATDEGYSTLGDTCTDGSGMCEVTGSIVCNSAGDGVQCSVTAGTGTDETCNGIDDDCDGDTDEALTPATCPLTVGVCAGTTEVCGGSSGWISCGPSIYGSDYESTETTCDGLDNDCDGDTDEGHSTLGDTCTVGTGACEATGSVVCNGAGDGTTCSASAGAPSSESCNGVDDDCDGNTDEAWPTVGDSCTEGMGACADTGTVVCNGAGTGVECTATAGTGSSETCNGIDDDCDGTTDEGLTAPSCSLTDGVCSGTTQSCGGSSGWLACDGSTYGSDYESDESSCDGLDNDCDGDTDEGYPTLGDTCTVGTGACEATGSLICNGTEDGVTCSATPGTASGETCNGIDDDCDGTTDEDLTAPSCALTQGVCAGTTQTCGGSSGWLACDGSTYGADYEAGDETSCDGLDNDCDGMTDEGDICPCSTMSFGGSTYLFCTDTETWQGARIACEAYSGYSLVSIESSSEDAFVWSTASGLEDTDWWIGLNDLGSEGTFTWINGSAGTYRNWASGQPNDFGGQDCVAIDDGLGLGETRGEWNDRSCTDNRPYVCETLP